MFHRYGPQCAGTTAVAGQESAAGQRFLIKDASLGCNPSVRPTIQHASRISNRVLLDAQRHQQTQAAKQATDTNVSNSATDLAEALGKNRETLQFAPPAERFNAICVHRLSRHRQNGHARERQLCARSGRSGMALGEITAHFVATIRRSLWSVAEGGMAEKPSCLSCSVARALRGSAVFRINRNTGEFQPRRSTTDERPAK